MAAKTADATSGAMPAGILAAPIGNALQVYNEGLFALKGPDAASLNGYVGAYTGAKGEIPLGLGNVPPGNNSGLGDTSASPVPLCNAWLGGSFIRKAVTGATTQADVGEVCYWSTDNDLTLTPPTRPGATALIVGFYTSTDFLVFVPPFGSSATSLAEPSTIHLGSYLCTEVDITGNIRTSVPMDFHGEILAVYAQITAAPAGSGGSVLLNVELDAVNVTGGVVTIATGDVMGANNAGTAVTALGVFHRGTLLDVEAASPVTFTGGSFDLYARVIRKPGA